MDSLKKSMKWDEDVYGLEYDLVREQQHIHVLVVAGLMALVVVPQCAHRVPDNWQYSSRHL